MKDKARLTLDMTSEEHKYLKMAAAKMGMTMREFLLTATFARMETLEDEWLAEKARETLKNIAAGKEEVISWEEMKKRLNQNDL